MLACGTRLAARDSPCSLATDAHRLAARAAFPEPRAACRRLASAASVLVWDTSQPRFSLDRPGPRVVSRSPVSSAARVKRRASRCAAFWSYQTLTSDVGSTAILADRLREGLGLRREIRYWRTKHGREIDIVLRRRGGAVVVIECKWSANAFEADHLPFSQVVSAGRRSGRCSRRPRPVHPALPRMFRCALSASARFPRPFDHAPSAPFASVLPSRSRRPSSLVRQHRADEVEQRRQVVEARASAGGDVLDASEQRPGVGIGLVEEVDDEGAVGGQARAPWCSGPVRWHARSLVGSARASLNETSTMRQRFEAAHRSARRPRHSRCPGAPLSGRPRRSRDYGVPG